MKLRYLFLVTIFLLAACTPANTSTVIPTILPSQLPSSTPSVTPSPVPSPTSPFPLSKLGTKDLDITYCTVDGTPLKIDLYYPKSGGPWPVLFYVHGGGWNAGDKSEGSGWQSINDQGILVVSVNYRLEAFNIKFPAMVEDIKCALRSLRANAREYNLDPDHIVAFGASAGGHLVALLGTSDPSAGWDVGEYLHQSSRVQAVVDIAGPVDFTRDFPSLDTNIFMALGKLPGTNDPLILAASPVTYVSSDDPPFLILHGDKDGIVPVEQGKIMDERLKQVGVPSTLVIVHGGDHSLKGLNGIETKPSQDEISTTIGDFILKYLLPNR